MTGEVERHYIDCIKKDYTEKPKAAERKLNGTTYYQTKCGTWVTNGMRYCPQCGKVLDWEVIIGGTNG